MSDKETGSDPAWSSVQAIDSESKEVLPASPEGKPRVLAVGTPPGVITFLRQMIEVTIETVQTVAQAQERIDRLPWDLFLFYHRGLRGGSASLLSRIRRCSQNTQTPIVYCLGKDVDPDLTKRLVREFGVQTLLTYPQDPQEIARHIAGLLGVPFNERDDPGNGAMPKSKTLSPDEAAEWEQFKTSLKDRAAILEQAATSLLEDTLSLEMRQEAARQSYQLVVDGGGYGLNHITTPASEAEQLLRRDGMLSPQEVLRFCELVMELQERTEALLPLTAGDMTGTKARPLVLAVSADGALLDRLQGDAPKHEVRIAGAHNLIEAMEAMTFKNPDLVLLDLGNDGVSSQELDFVGELVTHIPPIPVLALTEGDSFKDRVVVAGAGCQGIVDKRQSTASILDATREAAFNHTRIDVPKILVVDDSEMVARLASKLLERRGMQVTTLTDPLQFWDVLEQVNPDLLILDVEMPHLNGIELCRVVRVDPNWESLPVVFLSAHTDVQTIQRLFVAGADDFISKPIVSAELMMRVQNRLGRARLSRHRTEIDGLTGVAGRHSVEQMLERSIRTARRYRDPFSLAVVDVDYLKQINDRYETATGDAVLRRLGQIFSAFFRPEDAIGRLGGDEFVIGLHRASKPAALARIEELLRLVRRERFAAGTGEAFTVSVSAGLAEFPGDGSERQAIYHAAGQALSQAKAGGRDRVVGREDGHHPVVAEEYDVVIVDDDETISDMLMRMLRNQGYRSGWLRDGAEAIAKLGGRSPAMRAKVLLSEVDLPGLDGFALLRLLGNETGLRRMRVIMLTNRSAEDEVATMFELGAFDHMAKPFSPRILLQRIRRSLDA
ncbi:response regulator [Nitrospira sp. Nam80]